MDESLKTRQRVSDLMDGLLRDQAFSQALEQLQSSQQARSVWYAYHLVGDVLRSPDLAPGVDEAAFLRRLQQRLRAESPPRPVAADEGLAAGAQPPYGPLDRAASGIPAANDGRFSWKWVASFASLLVVAALGWNALSDIRGGDASAHWAGGVSDPAKELLVQPDPQGQPMIRDPRLDQLLMAHRQSGGVSVLQLPAGFLRNATFEVPARTGLQR